ncbi:hypothetical protein Ahy_B10g102184 [Arachis hypogaea]|uniref:Uncharacterized protein n=1 Tax=Arachis hypogaea TaxID=3818 RepID=A0A444X1A8_ARAHY|nr:hypothetical protein Ahy_B10g102184 [Arachis hypogaea]
MPLPIRQSFIPNPDPEKLPSFYIPVVEEDYSNENILYHCYESEELRSIANDEDADQPQVFPQSNVDAHVRQVKTFVNEHTCSRDNHCKLADEKRVVDELEERIRLQPSLTVRNADQFFRAEYDVLINERKIYRSMVKAKERIRDSKIAQYARLRDYAKEIIKTNPGSTVRIHTNPHPDSKNKKLFS